MIDGTKLTLIPQLSEGKTYSVTLPKDSIVGVNGASFDGLATYTLTTTDTTEPVVMRTIPPMNGEVAPGTQVELVFNKPIVATGNWTVTLTWEDRVEEVDVENVVIEENHLIVPVACSTTSSACWRSPRAASRTSSAMRTWTLCSSRSVRRVRVAISSKA